MHSRPSSGSRMASEIRIDFIIQNPIRRIERLQSRWYDSVCEECPPCAFCRRRGWHWHHLCRWCYSSFLLLFQAKSLNLRLEQINFTMKEDINRIKVVLAEKKRTNKWLAEQLGKDPATVSKWCTNKAQPGLETLVQIAECLQVDVKNLLRSSRRTNKK